MNALIMVAAAPAIASRSHREVKHRLPGCLDVRPHGHPNHCQSGHDEYQRRYGIEKFYHQHCAVLQRTRY